MVGHSHPDAQSLAQFAVDLDGGETRRLDQNSGAAARALVVDPLDVYWHAANGVFRVGLDGGVQSKLAPGGAIGALALDGDRVLWSNASGIFATPIAGGTSTQLTAVPASGLAVDGTSIYWVNGAGVFKVPK